MTDEANQPLVPPIRAMDLVEHFELMTADDGESVVLHTMYTPIGIQAIERLRLQPDDIVILRTDQYLTMDDVASLYKEWKGAAQLPNEVIVLDGGMTVEVLDPTDTAELELARATVIALNESKPIDWTLTAEQDAYLSRLMAPSTTDTD